jgi:hypothetical protein
VRAQLPRRRWVVSAAVCTSHEVFGLTVEIAWRVPWLRVPRSGTAEIAEHVAQSEAAALFLSGAGPSRAVPCETSPQRLACHLVARTRAAQALHVRPRAAMMRYALALCLALSILLLNLSLARVCVNVARTGDER